MPVTAIIGGQWGDEGKGKLVDLLGSEFNMVARYQGGANAGHTVKINDKTFILHQIPSGILQPGVRCLLGHGMVVDPVALVEEIDGLTANGIDVTGRILLSTHAHIVTPLHKAMDRSTGQVVGTTGRGVGMAYSDKMRRVGIRAVDLTDMKGVGRHVLQRLKLSLDRGEIYKSELPDLNSEIETFLRAAVRITTLLADTVETLNDALASGENILVEGAQGTLLDIDMGTYPFVTSSSSSVGGISSGLGIPAKALERVIGVLKAYTTRVGNGPFPTELTDETGEKLQATGSEVGATTGRTRRCGWFDAVAARYACVVNGFDEIYLTKLDVLDNFEDLKICTAYTNNGVTEKNFSAVLHRLDKVEPVYEELPGWNTSTTALTKASELPKEAQAYISKIETLLDTPVTNVSIGAERSQILKR